jgi:hypothetical protein
MKDLLTSTELEKNDISPKTDALTQLRGKYWIAHLQIPKDGPSMSGFLNEGTCLPQFSG